MAHDINTLPITIHIEVNHDHLADLIAQRLRDGQASVPGSTLQARITTTPGPFIEVAELRAQLGRRGRPMSTTTFKRRFIDTGLLHYVEGPNRAKRYVDRAAWTRIQQNR